MAIIVDPDNLDRFQVIFGTEIQQISIRDVGVVVSSQSATGTTSSGTSTFTDSGASFIVDGVAVGDVIAIVTGATAGHYVVASVDSATQLTVEETFSATESNLIYQVQEPTGGSTADGVTLQAIYSYSKEEWRADSATFGGDDLVRHEFPFEAITSEQFEIGGGAAHADWTWFNFFTRKRIRTGGWAERNTANTVLSEYAGIITLGNLDLDTQVYYQNVDGAAPINFEFLGPVNEAIQVFEDGGADNRGFLKLFARKKARTYAGSEIADIGVTTIQTIVNRFPLAAAVDPAITATDAEILGTSPYRNQGAALTTGIGGVTTAGGTNFVSATSTFQTDGVAPGDTLQLTSGTQIGYYTIDSVTSETELEIRPDFEFTTWGATEASLAFSVTSTVIIATRTDDATLANVDGVSGTLTSGTGGFTGAVEAGDIVILTEASDLAGIYDVISVDSDTQLTLDTTDRPFAGETNVDYRVVEPGMYLQYKRDLITLTATGDLTFADGNPDTIQRASGSWATDGVTAGTVIEITGSNSNNGSYTVASIITSSTADDTVVLVPTDTLVAEGPVTATATAYDGFKRDIGGTIYTFNWKVSGNNASLADIYQFVQHQLRQTTDIDTGNSTFRGDVTDLLMSFSTPTATLLNLFIDDLASTDINNATFQDATDTNRNFPFLASVQLIFNVNLQGDASARYWLFFSNDDAGNDAGADFSTDSAILVQDSEGVPVNGDVTGQSSISFTYDYDGNTQRGAGSQGSDAPVTLVAIGLDTAQYVITTANITRSTANTISAVAALERNYSNT